MNDGMRINELQLLFAIGLTPEQVPRIRGVRLDEESGLIVVRTRTGGGNRHFYESEDICRRNYPEYWTDDDTPDNPWNDDLRSNPFYVDDADDAYDETYANFYFNPPPNFEAI